MMLQTHTSTAALLVRILVLCDPVLSIEAPSVRPTDIWATEDWGGLPSLDDPGEPATHALNLDPPGPIVVSNSTSRLPNPCTDSTFQTPVYDFVNWNVTKTYLNASGEYPEQFSIAVTLRDNANNYSMQCAGDHIIDSGQYKERYTYCMPDNDDRFKPLVSFGLYQYVFEPRDYSSGYALGLEQFWYCSSTTDSPYPHVYKGFVRTGFKLQCPSRETPGSSSYRCTATTPSPLKADYTPTRLNQTEPLIPHPSPPSPPEEQLDPPPGHDCTDMSLTHPDWIIDNATYIPAPTGISFNTTTFNLTLTSRATGSQHLCRWGGDNLEMENYETMKMACGVLSPSARDTSETAFTVKYKLSNRELYIRQDWICGDTQRAYLRRYSATKSYVPPLFCADDSGRVCRANRHTVKGQLQKPAQYEPATIPPPPGASRQGCTSGSVIPTWTVRNFRFEETRTVRTVRTQIVPPLSRWSSPKRTISLDLRNPAIDYNQSCSITLSTEWGTNGANTWLRCFPETGIAQRYIETYVKFNSSNAELKINQTWYCSDTDASQPLYYQGTATTRAVYCGETNTTVYDSCSWPQCNMHTSMRWCSSGTYRNGQVVASEATVKGSVIRTERLPANALLDPDPDPNAWSCTADSLGRPIEWRLVPKRPEGFFSTTWSDVSKPKSMLSFELHNSALTRRPGGGVVPYVDVSATELTPYLPMWEPARTYDLWESGYRVVQGGRRPFANMLGWSLRFDGQVGYLELNHSWYCNDKSPSQPILFNGTWAGYVNMECKFNAIQDSEDEIVVGCYLPGGAIVIKPVVQFQVLKGIAGLPQR